MTAAYKKCPHCGKEVMPPGWIMVPVESWEKLVKKSELALPTERELDAIDHYLGQVEKKADDIKQAIWSARKSLSEAHP